MLDLLKLKIGLRLINVGLHLIIEDTSVCEAITTDVKDCYLFWPRVWPPTRTNQRPTKET